MTFFKAIMAAMKSASGPSFAFSGSLSASAASSPVTSTTRTVAGTGTALFFLGGGVGGPPEYQLNSGSWTTIIDSGTLALSNGDTFAVRNAMIGVGTYSLEITDNANGAVVQLVVLERT